MAYRNNDNGCGCLIAIFVVVAIISGVKSCTKHLINGDLELPKLGSSRVSGGSGGSGTSNGYNVKYKQTTSPNSNSSLRDYTHTNSQPTEYREGNNTQKANDYSGNSSSYSSSDINSISNSTSHSSISGTNSNVTNTSKPKTYYKTCSLCDGTGKREVFYYFFEDPTGLRKCDKCSRTDNHRHGEIDECQACSGKGKIKMEIIDGPLGEMEIRSFE